MMIKLINAYFSELVISQQQEKQLEQYYQYLVEQNKVMNLTTLVSREDVYIKHFLDSALLLKKYSFDDKTKVADVGSGAGFPGIILKIFCPTIKLSIIEAVEKRCLFLQRLITKLQLDDVEIVHARAESYSWEHSEQFDLVVSRAVANLGLLLELVVRMVKVQGRVICYKGPNIVNELATAQATLKVLNLELEQTQYENIPPLGERNICYFIKTAPTIKPYPRSFNQIKKFPIG
ncbi:16S rRNA (guanine(527)-N(7))-methyltransferase RsmG [Spiroplasma endosymbiont of Glossina fuscipes fuscipes]|uniref:16S rRNA (guanine(527)-N(7))-methyltransferase RsmG n=1 Tax=Spiroplasma endosymbiont of Glossina fuscipes fuscipes TaxID=2004463 RepID=UPI003C750B36